MTSFPPSIGCTTALIAFAIICGIAHAADGDALARLAGQSDLPGKLVVAESFEDSDSVPDGWSMWPRPGNGRSAIIVGGGAGDVGHALRLERDQSLWTI